MRRCEFKQIFANGIRRSEWLSCEKFDKLEWRRNFESFKCWLQFDSWRMQETSNPPEKFNKLVEQFSKTLRTWKNVSQEHRDYVLMKEVYHCSPKELEKVPERELNLHFTFLMKEREHEFKESKRAEQKAKQRASLHNHKQ